MADLEKALASNRWATDELIAVGERARETWNTPPAPGKWSPAHVTEHVARSYEEAANMIASRPSNLPKIPGFLRPLGAWMFRRILRTGKFPKARTTRAMNPEATPTTPGSPAEGKVRLHSALTVFETECRAHTGPINHASFGTMSVADYVHFTELHTRHHIKQIDV